MNRRRIIRVVPAAIALMLVILVSRGVALSAASGNPFDEVVAKLNAIIDMLTPPVPPGTVTLATSLMIATDLQQVICTAANLGTAPVAVDVRIINQDGTPLGHSPFLLVVDPGKTGVAIFGGELVALRCEFTVHGSATSVRANLIVENATGETAASVEAR